MLDKLAIWPFYKGNFMRTYHKIIAAALALGMLASAAYAETPLMVIRFNQKNVYFAKPLYNAVSQALDAKPNARFDVVSVTAGGPTGEHNLGKVVATLNEMGLPASRYSVTRRTANVAADEVRIYAH